jgi:ribonuclease HI
MNIEVFTDGSHLKPSDKCGYGIHFPNNEFNDISKPFIKLPKTNQRAELYAIYKAIKIIQKKDKLYNITIYSDSEYSIKSYTQWIDNWKKNNWIGSNKKPIKNQDIIKKTSDLMSKHIGKIKFIHVKAHTKLDDYNSIHNEITDKLAKDGANMTI